MPWNLSVRTLAYQGKRGGDNDELGPLDVILSDPSPSATTVCASVHAIFKRRTYRPWTDRLSLFHPLLEMYMPLA
jgi:hypothetical protein